MLKKTILAGMFFLFLGAAGAYAQFPAEGINYQAVARNSQGNVISSPITVRISILSGSPTGTLQYQETHNTTPNSLGLFNLSIGQGFFLGGAVNSFSAINWGSTAHYAKTEINTGSGYADMGTTQLWAVPYALYAKNAGSGGGGGSYTAGSGIGITNNVISAVDNSVTNELQNLSISGSSLSISNGNTVTLPSGGTTYTAGTGISISGNVISATAGTTYTAGSGISISGGVISAADNSATNELQTLSLSGNTLSIANGNNVTLPTGTTYTAGAGITITGNTIAAVDASATNEIQTLSLSGNTLSISGGNNITLPSGSGGGTLDQAYDFGGAGAGKTITADSGPVTINGSGTGAGSIGLLLTHNGTNTAGMGINFSGTGNGIQAISTNAANTFATIQGSTNSSNINNSAILGQYTGAARAVTGQVEATATADAAVRGLNSRTSGGMGVEGIGFNGVSGQTSYREGYGVFGSNLDAIGPLTGNSAGVGGIGFYGVIGQSTDVANGGAGIASNDNIVAAGTKNFRIDHPLDPANKYLNHFSIESNEVLNIYRGTITCDAQGMATVTLPDYVNAINIDFSYQLTPIGAYAGLFIGKKIENGSFVIAGALPGMEVSWQLTGKRNDAYLQAYPNAAKVETDKAEGDKGRYLRPELYNQPADKGIFRQLKK